jgi:hypothetical protein
VGDNLNSPLLVSPQRGEIKKLKPFRNEGLFIEFKRGIES